MKTRIMVVDDDMNMRDLMITLLESEGYDVIPAENAAAAQAAFDGPQPDAALLDLQLPDGHGLDLLPVFKKHWPETEVIVLTGNATLEAAVEATKRGAIFFQSKPVDPKNLMVLVKRALEQKQLKEEASSLRQALSTMTGGASPIFQSPAMKAVVHTVERVAPSDVSILITGESGTGKEVIADLVHALSPRSKGPLIKVNCAALPRELIESELFGSVKGAYTGAQADREGLFRQADGGSGPWAGAPVTRPIPASSPPQTARRKRPSKPASYARTCITASAPFPSRYPPCGSAARTFCRWPIRF